MNHAFKTAVLLIAASLFSGTAFARDRIYEVTITNLTRGQTFTPILVASHTGAVRLFELGQPASQELAELAEAGDTDPLTDLLMMNPAVSEVTHSGAPLGPGQTVTVEVSARHASNISVAAMLVPTNDGFMALNGASAPSWLRRSVNYRVPAYDAGSEPNDEDCINIPGPPDVCMGEGVSGEDGEGYVHIHAGIHGIGDLDAASYDWRNPVASISIMRTH